jgi:hypothetical protein
MNANQLARLQLLAVESYCRAEMTVDEFTGLMTAMGIQAETAGIGEEFKAAYRHLCWLKNGAQQLRPGATQAA